MTLDTGMASARGVPCAGVARERPPGRRTKGRGCRPVRRLLSLRNDVRLLSEEWDPHTNRQLGNTPQAFSHFALINSALLLHNGGAEHGNRAIAAPRPVSGSGLRPHLPGWGS